MYISITVLIFVGLYIFELLNSSSGMSQADIDRRDKYQHYENMQEQYSYDGTFNEMYEND